MAIAGYNFYDNVGGSYVKRNTSLLATPSFTRTGVPASTSGSCYFTAVDTAGNESAAGQTGSFTTLPVSIYSNLTKPVLILDDAGLATGQNNSYGTVDASGNVTAWKGIAPGLPETFTPAATAPTLTNGVNFAGAGALLHTGDNALWTFFYYKSIIADVKWTAHFVLKAGNSADPNAFLGFLGNTATSSANHGCAFGVDDRTSASFNNKTYAQVAVGAGRNQFTAGNNTTFVPNQEIVLSMRYNGNVTGDNRLELYINGTRITVPHDTGNTQSSVVNGALPAYPLEVGGVGNGLFPLVGAMRTVVLQDALESVATFDQFIVDLKSKYSIA